jgi:predicted phage-related endonuclease
MSQNEIIAKVKELKSLKLMAEELEAEIDSIQDSIKAIIGNQEELIVGEYKITYKPVTSERFDSKAFKATHSELYNQYTKTNTTRRFCVA